MNRIPAALAVLWWLGFVRLLPAKLHSQLRVAALCLLAFAVSAPPCLGAGVRFHFFDRLDPAHVSEALRVTIIGSA